MKTLLPFSAAMALLAAPAFAYTAQDATTCATFSMANWDFEVEKFSAEDRSVEWKEQAGGFVLVAERLGQDQATTKAAINAGRGEMLKFLKAFLSEDNIATERKFDRLSATCDRIFDKAPEMKPYK